MARESRPRKLVRWRNSELPIEIIFYNILPRLPPEALTRCKYVCKSWSSLIRSPSFVTYFNDRNKISITNFLFQKNRRFFSSKIDEQQGENNILIPTPIAQLPLPTRIKFLKRYPPDHVQYILNPTPVAELSYLSRCVDLECRPTHVQSLHGLVCASSRCGPVFILNPSTQESIQLPYIMENYRLASAIYNFGFSPLTNEYKVVQILSFHPDQRSDILFNIFTLGRDSSWRPLQVDPAHLPFEAPDHAYEIQNGRSSGCVCLNGAIYWINKTHKMIVVFDVREETFRVVPLPEEYAQEFHPDNYGHNRIAFHASVVEVGGCVGVFADKWLRQNQTVLWILKDYQNLVWVKETVTALMPRGEGYVKALGTIHTGELALALHFYENSSGFYDGLPQLLLYDMESKQHRILDFVFPNNMGVARGILIKLIASYEDSIVSLK